MQSLRAAQIHDSDEPTGESPAVSRQAKRYAHSERPADTTRVNVVKDSSSPSKTGGIGNIAGNTVSAGSSPSARRHQDILASPSWRRAGFVHQHGQAEDPFTTSSIASQTAVQQGQFTALYNAAYYADLGVSLSRRRQFSTSRG